MKALALIMSVAVLFSCSKQESGSNNETQAESPPAAATPSYTPPPDAKPVKLTPEEIEKAAWQVFLQLHFMTIYDGSVVGYKEEFAMTGDRITYKVLRHNVDNAGWQVSEAQVQYALSEDPNYTEGDSTYTPSYYNRRDVQAYNNEIDTLTVDAPYTAYVEVGEPESPNKTVRIIVAGGLRFENNKEVSPDETYINAPAQLAVADVIVNFSRSDPQASEDLYLKAKIMDLTDEDLSGLSKDELSFSRNEIFARHGHTFKTPKMINHFKNMDWYHVVVDDAAPLLNKFEKRNVEFIKKKEG